MKRKRSRRHNSEFEKKKKFKKQRKNSWNKTLRKAVKWKKRRRKQEQCKGPETSRSEPGASAKCCEEQVIKAIGITHVNLMPRK